MSLSSWFRDCDWDHYRAGDRDGLSYATSDASSNGKERWSVSIDHPLQYRIGEAPTLAGVQALAEQFAKKPMWQKRWLFWSAKRQAKKRDAIALKQAIKARRKTDAKHPPRGFWLQLWL